MLLAYLFLVALANQMINEQFRSVATSSVPANVVAKI